MKCWIVVTRAWILAKPRRGLKRGNVRVSTEKLGKTKQSWVGMLEAKTGAEEGLVDDDFQALNLNLLKN